MITITYKTACKKFGHIARQRCLSFKIKSVYNLYFKLCIHGLAYQSNYYIVE
ncbi:hypothetical protein UFOVP22_47 [uncultured Caudovirales phage]|uniref:Uncharacterized protein n=1 Tax=uncultured Caudovirales phage TaxID=2100421 RepID=A0A6J5T8N7_9CAUD|nr:hypothetical protein UFOVP22_47 [uncultured Caudovirales phage]